MLIDWFTVGAQVLNFIVLVWLLRRFLYRPILDAIDAREQRIAAELADAAAKQAEARRERDDFQHKNEVFEQQRAAREQQMADEVEAERQRLLAEARQAADALSAKRREALASDARNLDQAVSRWAREEVFAIARKALTDLSSAGVEERIVEVFIQRLSEADGKTKASLADALGTATDTALVRSAFELSPAQRTAIQASLNEVASTDVTVRFETVPALVGGIEVTANGQKVAWSIADYLRSLEHGVSDLLDRQAMPEPATKSKPQRPPEDTAVATPAAQTS